MLKITANELEVLLNRAFSDGYTQAIATLQSSTHMLLNKNPDVEAQYKYLVNKFEVKDANNKPKANRKSTKPIRKHKRKHT